MSKFTELVRQRVWDLNISNGELARRLDKKAARKSSRQQLKADPEPDVNPHKLYDSRSVVDWGH